MANPLDILTYQTYKLAGFLKERVMGSGTVIDSAKLKIYIGEKYGINYRKIMAYILGEHGDSQVAVLKFNDCIWYKYRSIYKRIRYGY